jgi:hypothetical protein
LRTLEPARRSPHLLDDHTVERIKEVFGVQRDDMWLWVETGERWQSQDLDAATAATVDQYTAAVGAFAASNAVILTLADELAARTIERTLAKSDLELGVEALVGGGRSAGQPFPDDTAFGTRWPPVRAELPPSTVRMRVPPRLPIRIEGAGSSGRAVGP